MVESAPQTESQSQEDLVIQNILKKADEIKQEAN